MFWLSWVKRRVPRTSSSARNTDGGSGWQNSKQLASADVWNWEGSHSKVHYTHTHPFNGPFSGTTRVSQYQKGKTSLNFTEARDNEWQWHQLGYMQVYISLQTDNHASTPPLKFFTGRMPFLPPNHQRQSTEGSAEVHYCISNLLPLLLP